MGKKYRVHTTSLSKKAVDRITTYAEICNSDEFINAIKDDPQIALKMLSVNAIVYGRSVEDFLTILSGLYGEGIIDTDHESVVDESSLFYENIRAYAETKDDWKEEVVKTIGAFKPYMDRFE